MHDPRSRLRGDPAAARALSPRCRDPLFGYPHHPARHEFGAAVRGRRGPQVRTSRALFGRHRSAAASRSGPGAEVCDRRGGSDPARTARSRALDRVCGKPLDGRHLHGGGRGQQDLRPHQAHAVRGAARTAPASRPARQGNHCLPQRADRRRRSGGHAVRYLGRCADAAAIRGFFLALHGRGGRRTDPRERRPPGTEHRVHQGRRRLARANGGHRLRRRGRRLDHGSGRRAPRRAAAASRCRGISIPRRCSLRPKPCAPKRCAFSTATAPGADTSSTWDTASRPMWTRSESPFWSIPCAITRST